MSIEPFWREQREYPVGPATEGNRKIEAGQTDPALTRQHLISLVGWVNNSKLIKQLLAPNVKHNNFPVLCLWQLVFYHIIETYIS